MAPRGQGCVPDLQAVLLSRTWCPALRETLHSRSLLASDSWSFGFSPLKLSRRVTKVLEMQALDYFDSGTITALSSAFSPRV